MKEENERNEGRDEGRKKMDEMKEEVMEENEVVKVDCRDKLVSLSCSVSL